VRGAGQLTDAPMFVKRQLRVRRRAWEGRPGECLHG
jgi:hypothetical protein